ncbi:hypothetical protein PG994_009738 [Apiospora phragmitis]|uniref:Rhodopsin domain-containing protein n=1 Tax=Apiospora phragmitis TaxID=2905665 RepID=A0ABR1U6X5_9PEZI
MPFDVNGTITIMPPPPGYVVNFADPPQEGVTVMWTVCIVENILAVMFLAQRYYTKMFIVRKFQAEDGRYPLLSGQQRPPRPITGAIERIKAKEEEEEKDIPADPRLLCLVTVLIAWLTSVATQGHLLHLYYIKAVGVHAFEMPLERYVVFSKIIYSAPLVYTVTVGAAKATLCLFYRRINPARTFQIGVWLLMFICVGSSAAVCFSLMFACRPIAASWDPLLAGTADCLDRPAIYVATAAIGVFTDVMLLVFPIPTIVGLNIRLRQKVALIGLFVVGSITMITSIVRLIILLPSLSNLDQTFALRSGTLWICIESNLLIMCCCLPTLRQFFRHVAPSWIGESKASAADSTGKLKAYALRTFGGSGPARSTPRRRSQAALDSFMMRTQGTRIGDGGDDYENGGHGHGQAYGNNKGSLDGAGWRSDSRFGATTDIRGGRRDDQSLEGGGGGFPGGL